ncbi:MAG: ArsR/SmtB family transcription factor [Thermoplasmatota archaeon]
MDGLEIIGSKARLKIMYQLSKEDKYVSQLMDLVGMDGKTAKHHLNKLEDAGIISSREEGKRKYYTLRREVILRISPSPNRKYEVQFPKIEK